MKHSTPSPTLDYIRSLFAQEDVLLQNIRQRLEASGTAIQIGAEEGKLLQVLIRMNQVKSIVEVGTLAGYSAIWMARALPEDGRIYTIEHDPIRASMAKDSFAQCEVKDRITLCEGEGVKVLEELAARGPFDMVFIDADKISYDRYLDWAEKHIRPGGLIVADNVFLFGAVYEPNADALPENVSLTGWVAVRSFNERIADKDKFHSVIIPTEQGLAVAIKK